MNDNMPSLLVVEDNLKSLSFLFNVLREAGFEVLVAQDGKHALRSAEEARPNMILLDVIMSGIDGFETCRRLKASEKTQHIPVIFMTGLTKTVDKVKGFELGAVDYITKPVEPEEMLVRVKTHLTIQQLQQDLYAKNKELQASLEREQELNTFKSRFMSIASHEFRNPLTAILFSNNLLRRYTAKLSSEKESDKEIVKDMVEELDSLEKPVGHMITTLDEILRVSKSEAKKLTFRPSSIDLGDLCQHVVERFNVTSPETHAVTFLNTTEHIQAFVDPKLVDQILSNLLSNALKYSPSGGNISCGLFRKNDDILLSVKDEGIGISEDDRLRLFEAFHRGVNVDEIQGAGLGLSIVKQFVELHGGAINVKSQINRGTTFTVVLPLHA